MTNYGFYLGPNPTPEWMRAERFEYCDQFENQKENEEKNILKLLGRLFK